MRDDTAATHERRTGDHVRQLDALLGRNEALLDENADLRRQLEALEAAAPSKTRSLLIRP
jgi:cell division septum initiation protein DivIVA